MSDKDYINICKSLIADRYLLGDELGQWRQRDFEALSKLIEQKSGIRLSLSTLKRLWKSEFNQSPHPATLDAIASILDYQNWLEFKSNHRERKLDQKTSSNKSLQGIFLAIIIIVSAIAFVGFLSTRPTTNQSQVLVTGPIDFTANKTVSTGVPNTVIFKYDVENIAADSFFLQQSWNEVHREDLDPKAGNYSSIYYVPGFHRAKLLANDSILEVKRVHIKTDGWLPLVRNNLDQLIPVYLRDPEIVTGGTMQVTSTQLQSAGVELNKNFILSYHNVQDYDLHSDNFQLKTKVKADSMGNYACPEFQLTIVCEEHIYYVPLTTNGCVGNIGVKFGEVIKDSENSDLSAFGVDMYHWQQISIKVRDKQATVQLNQDDVFQVVYREDFGKIMGLVFTFTGPGAVDFVQLQDLAGNIKFEDTFL